MASESRHRDSLSGPAADSASKSPGPAFLQTPTPTPGGDDETRLYHDRDPKVPHPLHQHHSSPHTHYPQALPSLLSTSSIPEDIWDHDSHEHETLRNRYRRDVDVNDQNISVPASSKHAEKTVMPFLAQHIPAAYNPAENTIVGHHVKDSSLVSPSTASLIPSSATTTTSTTQPPTLTSTTTSNTKYCYRHQPDLKCRRPANEPTMDQLQSALSTLSQSDQRAISHVWSLFSAAPSKHRNLMLQGILTQCCFPQLSFIAANVRDLIKIDFLTALPDELCYQILCFLDTTSLCKAAQVSTRWRSLADDDVVWHRMCEQHIDRKCTKCGWGLPLLERKRLRIEKRQIQLRATGGRNSNSGSSASIGGQWSPEMTPVAEEGDREEDDEERRQDIDEGNAEHGHNHPPSDSGARTPLPSLTEDDSESSQRSIRKRRAESTLSSPELVLGNNKKRRCSRDDSTLVTAAARGSDSYFAPRKRPWKDIYKDRFKVGTAWKYGRCSTKVFKGHTNGVMCVQFDDNVLISGSYDATIKVWDVHTGEELRTLRGHGSGIRCLQFDETGKLMTGSLDATIRLWNWQTGALLRVFEAHSDGVLTLHYTGGYVASGSRDRTIRVWDSRIKETFLLRGHWDWVNSVKVDAPSRTLFSASDDLTVRIWDLDAKQCVRMFEGHVAHVQQVLPMPEEFELDDLSLGQQQLRELEARRRRGLEEGRRTRTERERRLVEGGAARSVSPAEEEDDTREGRDDASSVGSGVGVRLDRYQPPEESTAAARSAGTADASESSFFWPQDPERPPPPRYMMTGSLDSTIRLWDTHFATSPGPTSSARNLHGHDNNGGYDPHHPATAQGGQELTQHPDNAAAAAPPTAQILPTDPLTNSHIPRAQACIRTFFGHVQGVWSLAADHLRLISGSEDGMMKVWDPRTGKCERTFTGHQGPVTCAWLGDERVASGGEDGTVRVLWFGEDG